MAVDRALEHDYEENIDYSLCAVLVQGGSVISVGFNNLNTNGFMEHFATKVKGHRNFCLSMHAECHAVYQARSKTDLRGAKIYVARIRPPKSLNGKVGNARPCEVCQYVLGRYGIKKAYYTISDYEYGVMNVSKMNDHTVSI